MTEFRAKISRRDAIAGAIGATTLFASGSVPGVESAVQAAPMPWDEVRNAYDALHEPVNLISGANNPSPRVVLKALIDWQQHINPSPLARGRGREITEQKESIRERLAVHCGASANELALTRGTTEGMNIAISGIALKSGDEILTTRHDYPSIKDAMQRRARLDDITIKECVWEPPIASHETLVETIRANVTSRTRAIVVCHVYDGYGQVMPIREISELAHENGAIVIVDGALGFGNVPTNLQEMGCDFYATSLHKWLGAPRGTGMLYVKKEHIASTRPMYGVPAPQSDDIRKFEDIGTSSPAPTLAVAAALDILEHIGAERKYARLQELKNY